MFTWECPTCGREIDIAENECPSCSRKQKAPAASASPAAPAARSPVERRAPRGSWGAQQKQLVLFGVLALIAAAAAVYFGTQGRFAGDPGPEEPLLTEGSGDSGSAYLGDLEVAGIRTSYDEDFKTQVRAVVINHGESPQSVTLQAALRTRQSSTNDTPLGSFEIQLDEALAPGESREVETDLTAFGTLASLPPWYELRVDLAKP